jgi:hypothetical protein
MTNKQKWAMLAVVLVCSWVGKTIAQQQFSGGQAVTVTSGTLAATQSGTWTVQPGNTANTTAWKVDGSAVTQPTSLAALPALVAGTAKVGVTYPYTGCGTTTLETPFTVLTGASITAAAATTCVLTLVITNTGSGSFTYFVTDNAGTPLAVIGSSGNPITILAGERDEYTFPNGAKFTSGVKISSSAATGSYYILGLQ